MYFKVIQIFFLIVALICCSCNSVQYINLDHSLIYNDKIEALNSIAKDQEVKIFLTNKETLEAKKLHVTNDSTFFKSLSSPNKEWSRYSNYEIESIYVQSTGGGVGFGIGLGVGIVTALIVAEASMDEVDPDPKGLTYGLHILIIAPFCGLIGYTFGKTYTKVLEYKFIGSKDEKL